MRRHRIRALADGRHRPCTTNGRHPRVVAPNLLKQRLKAPAPTGVRPADITTIAAGEGWPHSAAVLNLAARTIMGRAIRDHMRAELAAPMMAIQQQRPGPGLIHHSDKGSQLAAEASVEQFAGVGAVPSMSRIGDRYGHAPKESFFHTLKVDLVHQHRWAIRDEARRDLFAQVAGHCSCARIRSALGCVTPEQAEQMTSQDLPPDRAVS